MSLVYFNLAVNRAVEKSHFYTEERRDIYLAQMEKIMIPAKTLKCLGKNRSRKLHKKGTSWEVPPAAG